MNRKNNSYPHAPKQSSAKRPRRIFGDGVGFLLVMGLPIIAFLLILFAPVDVLDRWPWARAMCDEVLRIFPPLKRQALFSPFPQVRQFGICLVAALTPVQLVMLGVPCFLKLSDVLENFRQQKDRIKWGWASMIAAALAMLGLSLHHATSEPSSLPFNTLSRLMETQRFSAAFSDSGLLMLISICSVILFFSVCGALVDNIRKADYHE
jgi:hypothetical protein